MMNLHPIMQRSAAVGGCRANCKPRMAQIMVPSPMYSRRSGSTRLMTLKVSSDATLSESDVPVRSPDKFPSAHVTTDGFGQHPALEFTCRKRRKMPRAAAEAVRAKGGRCKIASAKHGMSKADAGISGTHRFFPGAGFSFQTSGGLLPPGGTRKCGKNTHLEPQNSGRGVAEKSFSRPRTEAGGAELRPGSARGGDFAPYHGTGTCLLW